MFQVMKKFSRACSLIVAAAMLCAMLGSAVVAEQVGADGYVALDPAQAEALAGVYEYDLVMGEGMALTLYLNIDDAGKFVLSRSTDFSSPEKGAGEVLAGPDGGYAMDYSVVNGEEVEAGSHVATFALEEDGGLQFSSPLWFGATKPALTAEDGTETYLKFVPSEAEVVEKPNIVSGDYAVDTSWSKQAAALSPVLGVNAEAMTFTLKDAAKADVQPVSGAIAYAGGVYALTTGDGRTLSGVYDEKTGTLSLSATATAAPVEEDEGEAEGLSGKYLVDLSQALLASAEDLVLEIDEGAMSFKTYEAAAPDATLDSGKIEAKDDAYQLIYDGVTPVEGAGTTFIREGDAITLTSTATAAIPVAEEGVEEGVKFGTYGGKYTYQPGGMPMAIDYYYTLTLNEDGSYRFKSYYVVSDEKYDGFDETGSYSAASGMLTLKSSAGKVMKGTIDTSGNATLHRSLGSGMNGGEGSAFDITLTHGRIPAPGDAPEISYGTYGGTHSVEAMGGTIDYAVTLNLKKDGTYDYKVSFVVGGQTYTETESGTYKVDGESMRLTNNEGKVMVGKVRPDGTASVTRLVSSFATSAATVALKLGYAPSAGGNADPKPETTPEPTAAPTPAPTSDPGQKGFKTGLYKGAYSYQPNGMPMSIDYTYQLNLKDDGTYDFESTYKVSGADYEGLKENGTYTVQDGALTLTADDGTVMTGTIDDKGNANLRRALSPSMSGTGKGTEHDIALAQEDDSGKDEANLSSGKYKVDISWSPMGGMIAPVLEIDAEKMTFNLYNASAPETSKGAGTISHAGGVYTLEYENGNTTSFTYADGVITFTSKLWYGASSFNSAGEDGTFVPYTATRDAAPIQEEPAYKTGTYGGKYTNVSKSGRETDYVYTLTLNEDKSYTYTASFAMGGDVYTQTEKGTYTVENGALTLTSNGLTVKSSAGEEVASSASSETLTGSLDAEGSGSVNRYVSYFAAMAGSKVDLPLTYGYTPSLEIKEESASYKTGTYGGEYTLQPEGMPMPIDYVYSLTLNEDKSYSFTTSYTVAGRNSSGLSESGSYTAEEGKLTLTASDGSTYTGTIDGSGKATLTRNLSKSSGDIKIDLTYGYAPSAEKAAEPAEETESAESTEGNESSEEGEPSEETESVEGNGPMMAMLMVTDFAEEAETAEDSESEEGSDPDEEETAEEETAEEETDEEGSPVEDATPAEGVETPEKATPVEKEDDAEGEPSDPEAENE